MNLKMSRGYMGGVGLEKGGDGNDVNTVLMCKILKIDLNQYLLS